MVSGEFVSQFTLHSAVPDFTPKPYAWGTYAADPKIHFILCAFIDMDEKTLVGLKTLHGDLGNYVKPPCRQVANTASAYRRFMAIWLNTLSGRTHGRNSLHAHTVFSLFSVV